eukprot:1695819-Rhodomonas_salina.1
MPREDLTSREELTWGVTCTGVPQLWGATPGCVQRQDVSGLALRCADSTPRWVTSQIPLSVVRRVATGVLVPSPHSSCGHVAYS